MNLRETISAARVDGPVRAVDGTIGFEFEFGPEEPTFQGHFPGNPLLPGIFQIEMTRAAAEWTLARPLELREVGKAKFQRPIWPAERVRLELRTTHAGQSLRAEARFSVAGQLAGETTLTLWDGE